jgi:hypothetical protein
MKKILEDNDACITAYFILGIGLNLFAVLFPVLFPLGMGLIGIPILLPRLLTPGGFLQIINILKQSLNSMLNLLTL